MAKTKSPQIPPKKKPLWIEEFTVCNFMRLEGEHTYKPEEILIFEAPNGYGKTSMLTAIQTALSGKAPKDIPILNDKAEEGFIRIRFDNQLSVLFEFSKTKRSKLSLIHPEFGPIEDAKAYLEKINNALTINPLKFINADDEQRATFMLEAMPTHLKKEQIELLTATPRIIIDMANLPSDASTLDWLDNEYNRIYKEREIKGRDVTAKKGVIKNYESLLASDKNLVDVRETVTSLESERTDIEEHKAQKLQDLNKTHTDKIQKSNDDQNSAIAELDAEYKIREKALNDWYNSELNEKRQFHLGQRSAMTDEKNKVEKAIGTEFAPRLEQITIELAKYSVEIENLAKAEKQKEIIDETKAELDILTAEYNEMTAALGIVDKVRLDQLEDLPIKGLKIVKGKVFHNGKPWNALSTAEQMDIAADIASLFGTGIMPIDKLEGFDSKRMAAFKKSMEKKGIQVLGSRVPQDPEVKELRAVTK